MTTINAIRFDEASGIMICDEQRHWNPELMKIYAADKIRPVVPAHISRRYGIAAAYGNTGTSAIGDELRLSIYRRIDRRYRRLVQEQGAEPDTFLSIDAIAQLAWDTICDMKHTHTDDYLAQTYGFRTADFIAGSSGEDGDDRPIANLNIVREAMKQIALEPGSRAPHAVFGNGGILAGFDQQKGFSIYAFSMRDGTMEEVECGFAALGSGSDTTNFVFPRFFSSLSCASRCRLDPVAGTYAALSAVVQAAHCNLGVGGYYNLLFFKQKAPAEQLLQEINDHRGKLAGEIVQAHLHGLLADACCYDLLKGLLFQDKGLAWAEQLMWQACSDPLRLHRLLRGYPLEPAVRKG